MTLFQRMTSGAGQRLTVNVATHSGTYVLQISCSIS